MRAGRAGEQDMPVIIHDAPQDSWNGKMGW
jgi:hypothetical protein